MRKSGLEPNILWNFWDYKTTTLCLSGKTPIGEILEIKK